MRKSVTVVFTDVAGSTSLGENLDPERLRGVMDRYFERMRSVLERHGGTVEKYIGDAVMAVFGAPLVHEDDPLRAVTAAAEMRQALAELNSQLERDWGLRIEARTGVNTGQVVVGDTGSGQSFATGDAVNLAARLQQAASPGEILLGEETWRLVGHAVTGEPLGPFAVKGKGTPVRAVRLLEVVSGISARARHLQSPLVGRDEEMAALADTFERSLRARRCELFTILGEAGVGKSRLVEEFLTRTEGQARILQARCLPYGQGITFWPIAEVVKAAADITEADSPDQARSKIDHLVSDDEDAALIGARVAAAVGLTEGAGVIQETFWSVRRLFEALTRSRPLIVVFDDIQWAEPPFLHLVEYVSNFSKDHPLLLLCMARPELMEMHPGWGATSTVLRLESLSEAETHRLIDGLLGQIGISEEARERIAGTAEGNPLFVEEILRMLIDDGTLRREDGRWVRARDLSERSQPATIRALLSARLDRLNEEERAVIQRASVVGRVFYWAAVTELAPDIPNPRIGDCFQALTQKDLIQADASSFVGEDAYRFSHILIRDAAYDSIPKETRADLHQRFAGWMERVAGDRASEWEEIIGYHLERAYRLRKELGPVREADGRLASRAAERLASSGRRAFARNDVTSAINLLGRAVSLLSDDEALGRKAKLELAEALLEAGEFSKAEELLRTAGRSPATRVDERLGAHVQLVRLRLALHTDPQVDVEDVHRQAKRAIMAFERARDERGLARAWSLIARARGAACRAAARQEALERALRHARRAGDRREETNILAYLTSPVVWGPIHVDEGLRRLDWILQQAEGDRKVEAAVLWAKSMLRAMQAQFEEARMLATRSSDILEDLGLHVEALVGSAEDGAVVEMLAGDPAAAEGKLRPVVEALQSMGETAYLSTLMASLADAVYAQGRYGEAERLAEISETAAAAGDLASQVDWRRVRAKILAQRGSFDDAESLGREAVRIGELTDYWDQRSNAHLDHAEVLRHSGRDASAVPYVEQAVRVLEEKGNTVSAQNARETLLKRSAHPD